MSANKRSRKDAKMTPLKPIEGLSAQPLLKLQALDEKSFFVYKMPTILGSEDHQSWKIKKARLEEEMPER